MTISRSSAWGASVWGGTSMPPVTGSVAHGFETTVCGSGAVTDAYLTLTTCHPKGSARQRLVVRAALQGAATTA